jgi:glycosyltransferase involved in cell wall biosynthesis
VLNPGLSTSFLGKQSENKNIYIQKKYNLPSHYILFLGTIEPRKNIEGLIDAFVVFQKEFPQYHLVISGAHGWKNKRILAAIEKNKNVQYIGYVASQDKSMLYCGATVFVYPSLYEGFGFPVLEAFASGVPVITSARSSLPEIAGDAAYYVNPYNSLEIAEGLRRFVTDPALSTLFIQKGFLQIQKFSWKKMAEQFLASL